MHRDLRSWVEIDLTAFTANFLALKALLSPGIDVMQIVKADGYGHGAGEIATKALECGSTCLGIANADEGAILRLQGFTCPIIILSPSLISEIPVIIENNLTPSVSDLQFALAMNRLASEEYNIHINIDSGMGRSGIRIDEAFEIYSQINFLENICIEGIFTHFAASESDAGYTQSQINAFNKFLEKLPVLPKYIHYANSSTLLSPIEIPGNMVRLGALTYGFYTDISQKEQIILQPVMNFKSRIIQLKTARKGEYIGYNKTYCCKEDLHYAIIPVGYADGYDHLLSNLGKVAVAGKISQVIGKVSMDMIAIDVSGISVVSTGMEVQLLGNIASIRVEEISALYGGSPYELLCQTGRRAKRLFYEQGNLVASTPRLRREFVSTDYDDKKLNRIIEAAIAQRLQSSEIADFVTEDLINNIFKDRDKQIFYRHGFRHKITFLDEQRKGFEKYYIVKTELSYRKMLSGSHFVIACANNEENLSGYFLQPEVEYRWLLDNLLPLTRESFLVDNVYVNDIKMETSYQINNECLEIHCSNDALKAFVDHEADFLITTTTFYPRSYHQLSVFITDITCGYAIEFNYPENLNIENTIPIFSGRNKFPLLDKLERKIIASSEDWVFPLSGIVFVYDDVSR